MGEFVGLTVVEVERAVGFTLYEEKKKRKRKIKSVIIIKYDLSFDCLLSLTFVSSAITNVNGSSLIPAELLRRRSRRGIMYPLRTKTGIVSSGAATV